MVAQMRVRRGTTLLSGPQPTSCPEIRLACHLKPSSVRGGVGGGKPPGRSQTPVTLGQDVRRKNKKDMEEGRRREDRGIRRLSEEGEQAAQHLCCFMNGLGCTLLKCPYIRWPIWLNKDL